MLSVRDELLILGFTTCWDKREGVYVDAITLGGTAHTNGRLKIGGCVYYAKYEKIRVIKS